MESVIFFLKQNEHFQKQKLDFVLNIKLFNRLNLILMKSNLLKLNL